MKIKIGVALLAVMSFFGCGQNGTTPEEPKSNVVLYEGAVELSDKKFGLY